MDRQNQLKQEIKALTDRIHYLKNQPNTRRSAVGVMIQESWVIDEWCKLDEQLGKKKAELHLLENVNDDKEIMQLVCRNNNSVIPVYSKNGILIRGGMLENYFKGRLIEEHDHYVRNRYKRNVYQCEIKSAYDKDNIIIMQCLIDRKLFEGQMNYQVYNGEKHFIFRKSNFNFKRMEGRIERGLSVTEKTLIWYMCALYYQNIYANDKNINLSH